MLLQCENYSITIHIPCFNFNILSFCVIIIFKQNPYIYIIIPTNILQLFNSS